MKLALVGLVTLIIGLGLEWSRPSSQIRHLWQQAVSPGELSQSHRFLANDCAACHTPMAGVNATLCTACHADNEALLQRQPTSFHGNIQVCAGCHLEHQGGLRMPTSMDHAVFAAINHNELQRGELRQNSTATDKQPDNASNEKCGGDSGCASPEMENILQASQPQSRLRLQIPDRHTEATLACVNCHATKDRHQGLFGSECVQCHSTNQWTNPEFVHPSVRSTECAQCHKPPPSHNMMHFKMVSATIAKQPAATVEQCHLCHQSTSWNDIKGAGWVKHH